MGAMSTRLHIGPLSFRLRGLSLREQLAADKETVREAQEGLRSLRALFTRDTEPKKIKKLRRETARENERLARQHRRDGTIT